MLHTKSIFSATIALILPIASQATPIFTITPMSSSFSVTQGTTAEVQYDVRNVSGRSITITNERVTPSSNVTSDAISANSNCENTQLASNSDCTLDVDITGNKIGSDTVKPVVCAFNGQLCSTAATATSTTVVAQNTFNCATNSTTKQCRVFTTAGTYKGDLSEGSGAVSTANCQSNASGVTKGNCVCEDEAAAAGYGHPGHWRVWLSTDAQSALSNIKYTGGGSLKYVRAGDTDIQVAAQGALTTANLSNSIKADSVGNFCTYTATRASTGAIPEGRADCDGWTSTATQLASVDRGDAKGAARVFSNTAWSEVIGVSVCAASPDCSNTLYLYCFETPQ